MTVQRDMADAERTFPSDVSRWLPPWQAIPDAYRHGDNPYRDFVRHWFFEGIDLEAWDLRRKKGISDAEAQRRWQQVQACLASFQPKHEHKEAGCAYLLSQFLEPPRRHHPRRTTK